MRDQARLVQRGQVARRVIDVAASVIRSGVAPAVASVIRRVIDAVAQERVSGFSATIAR